MRTALRRCGPCGLYTLKDDCPKCKARTVMPLPPRYSPEDKYGKYRRQLKALSEAGK